MKITLFFTLFFLVFSQETGKKQNYIIFKDGTKKFYKKVEYKTALFSKSKLIADSTEIKISDVYFVQDDEEFYTTIAGKLPLTSKGKRISVFSRTQVYTHMTPGVGGMPGGMTTTASTIAYLSKDLGKPVESNYDNIFELVKDNPKSLEKLSSYKTLRMARIGIGLVGLGIIISAFSDVTEQEGPNTQRLIGGAVFMNLAWIPHLMSQGLLSDAIDEYNK